MKYLLTLAALLLTLNASAQWTKFHKEADELKGTSSILRTRNAGIMFNPVGQAKKVKKMYKHLHTTGYLRIVAPRHEASDYDIKIPHLPE